jgi:hypothetical protein
MNIGGVFVFRFNSSFVKGGARRAEDFKIPPAFSHPLFQRGIPEKGI